MMAESKMNGTGKIEKSAFDIDDDYNFDDETPRSDLESDRINSRRANLDNVTRPRSKSNGNRPVSNSMNTRDTSNMRRKTTVTKSGFKRDEYVPKEVEMSWV